MLSRFARLRGRLPHAIAASLLGGASVLAPVAVSAQAAGIAEPDTATIDEDSAPVVIQVLSNDNAGVEITGFAQASNGTVGEVNIGGVTTSFTYEPDANFNGDDSFTYDVLDPSTNETETETVSIAVDAVDDAPVAFDDDVPAVDAGEADVIVENGPAVDVAAAILANDVELDGEELTITSVDASDTIGAVVLDGDSVTFEATDDVATSTSFGYTVTDGTSEASATVNVTIEPVDDPPVAVNDGPISLNEGETADVDVRANDTDVDEGPLEVTSALVEAIDPFFTDPVGSVSVSDSGQVTYEAPDDMLDPLDLLVTYELNGGSTATFAITVNTVDDAPVATDDTADVLEGSDVLIPVLANDTDVDGGPLDIENITAPSVGTAVEEGGEIRYTHEGNALDDVTFSYTLNGGAQAGVTVSVSNNDQDAITVDDVTADIAEDAGEVTIEILAEGQTDVDGDLLSIVGANDGDLGTTTFDSNMVTYTPDENANGEDSFTVSVTDGDGEYDTDLTVTVNIAPVDDIPVVDDLSVVIPEDVAFAAIPIIFEGQTDADGTLLSITDATDGTLGTTTIEGGTVTYVPAADANGEDSFTVTVTDGTNPIDVNVEVSITPADDVPVVDDVSIDILEDAETVEITILAADQTDVDGEVLRVADTEDGDLGIAEVAFDTAVAYTPDADANGEDSFIVTVTDGINDVDVTVTVNITPVNDAPVAEYDDFENDNSAFSYVYDVETESYSYLPTRTVVLEDEVTLLPVLDNDYDVDGDDIEIVSDSISIDSDIASFEIIEGAIELTPVDDWSGFFSFSYVITDGELESEQATVYVWVVPTLDVPVAEEDVAYVNEDDVVWVSVLENDYDADNPIHQYYFDDEFDIIFDDEPVAFIGGDEDDFEGDFDDQQLEILSITQPENGFAFLVDDRIRVQPDPNFVGTLELEYEIRSEFEPYWSGWEGSSTIDCSFEFNPFDRFFGPFGPIGGDYCPTTTGVLIVEVLGQNDSLEAANDTATTNEDEDVTIDVLDNDTDIDGDELSVTRVGAAANGTVELIDGEVVYTPDENFFGTDDFVYFVTDGSVLVVAEVDVTINSVNDVPTIEDENRNTAEDSALKFDLKIFDVEDDDLVPTLDVAPENGSVEIDGQTMTFTPEENWSGLATFGFKVDDGDGGIATNTVTINVFPVNDAPTIEDQSASVDEDSSVEIDIAVDDIDSENLTISVVGGPANGSATVDGLTVTYTPNANVDTDDSFEVQVSDGEATATATVDVTINPVNDVPTIEDDDRNTAEDSALKFDLKIFDVETPDIVPTLDVAPENGSVEIDGQTMTFTPEENWSGLATFGFKVDDGDGGTATNTITINVRSVNDAPTIEDESASVDEDSSVDIEMNVDDVEADDLTISVVDGPARGSVSVEGLTVTYTPEADVHGDDSFEVQVSDGEATATATVDVTINPVNDVPLAVECGPYEVEAGASVDFDATACATDADGDALSIVADSVVASAGSVSQDGATLTFTAPADAGSETVSFTLTDDNGGELELTANVTVTAPPVVEVEEPEEEEEEEQEETPSPFIGADGLDGQVVRIYSAMLGRLPDQAGFEWWVEQRENGMEFEEMVDKFADSPEFKSTFGDRIATDSNEQWVDFVYVEIMDRNPESIGQQFWIGALASGAFSRSEMVIWFAESPEYRAITQTS